MTGSPAKSTTGTSEHSNSQNANERARKPVCQPPRCGNEPKLSHDDSSAASPTLTRNGTSPSAPPRITGACLVLTQGWLDAQTDPEGAEHRAKETTRIERLAVDAVLRVEHALGHQPTEMPHNNPGYDIESETPAGLDFIEVKGRITGGTTFVLTRQEAVTALNKGERSILALVRVGDDDATTVRYLRHPITHPIDPRAARVEYDWDPFWNDATEMSQE